MRRRAARLLLSTLRHAVTAPVGAVTPEPTIAPVPPEEPVDEDGASPEAHALGALSPRSLAPQMLAGGVAPFLVYALCRHFGVSDGASLALSSVPPAVSVLVSWAWRRRLDPIGLIALVSIGAGLIAMAALDGNELMLKLRESVITGLFGLVCLVTLVTPGKPAMFVMGRALTRSAPRSKADAFDALWELPEARRVFVVLTAAWGVGLVLEAGARTLLALTLPTGPFLAITPVLGWAVIGGLIYFTVSYVRARRRDAPPVLPARGPAT
jgi:hypothetical protein